MGQTISCFCSGGAVKFGEQQEGVASRFHTRLCNPSGSIMTRGTQAHHCRNRCCRYHDKTVVRICRKGVLQTCVRGHASGANDAFWVHAQFFVFI